MIPKILHYCFGMAPDFGGKPWSLVHYACVKSAVERLRPDRVFLYYAYEPSGPWWDLSRPLVTSVRIDPPQSIFGNPLCHPAHRADVVRLEKLLEHGGIYLDTDVFVHRDFDDLLAHSCVLGQQDVGGRGGLCNAIILAERQAPFLKRWHAEYTTFRSKGRDVYWDEHSVKLPLRLARAFPDELTVLPHDAFFWPLWTADHLDWIYNSTRPIERSRAYATHLWESQAWERFLEHLTVARVRRTDSNFHRWIRPMLASVPDGYGTPNVLERAARAKRIAVTRLSRRYGPLTVQSLAKRAARRIVRAAKSTREGSGTQP